MLKHKIGDIVRYLPFAANADMPAIFGIITQIDNKCSKLYDKGYTNPDEEEYYVYWQNGAWSRYTEEEFKNGPDLDVATKSEIALFASREIINKLKSIISSS